MEEEDILKKIEEILNKEEEIFTEDERKTLKKMVRVYQAFEVLGGVGSVIKNTLGWFVFIGGTWFALKSGLINWLGALK